MIKNEWHRENNVVVKNSAVPTTRESTKKCGQCEKFNDAVCQCQMPFDIEVILEQVSKCSITLREQMRIEKVRKMKQNNVISDVKSFESKSCATAKEHMHKGYEENKKDNDRKEKEKENEW